MSCVERHELLEFSLQLFDNEETQKVKAHLENCANCQRTLDSLQNLNQNFQKHQKATSLQASSALKEGLFERLKAEEPSFQNEKHESHGKILSISSLLQRRALLLSLAAACLFGIFLFNWEKKPLNPKESLPLTQEKLPKHLEDQNLQVLAKAFSSEMDHLMSESEFEISLEEEAKTLADDYFEDVIFATVEAE